MPYNIDGKSIISEQVLEVRYKPAGRFVDIKGKLADSLIKFLPHWQIGNDNIILTDNPGRPKIESAFVGYKSAGYSAVNPSTGNFFQDKCISFWKMLDENGIFEIPAIERVGLRSRIFIESKVSREEIDNLFIHKIYSSKINQLFTEDKRAVKFYFELKVGGHKVVMQAYPFGNKDEGKIFSFVSDELFKSGLFIDIDYFVLSELNKKDIPDFVRKALSFTTEKSISFFNYLGL